MSRLLQVVAREPVRVVTVAQAVLALLAAVGVAVDQDVAAAVLALLAALVGLGGGQAAREAVWPWPAHREALEAAYGDGHRDGAGAAAAGGREPPPRLQA